MKRVLFMGEQPDPWMDTEIARGVIPIYGLEDVEAYCPACPHRVRIPRGAERWCAECRRAGREDTQLLEAT